MNEFTELEWRQPFRARITGQSTVGGLRRYTWLSQTHAPGDGSTEDADWPRQGDSTSGWALELNNANVPTNTIVTMRFRGMVTGYPTFEFAYEPSSAAPLAVREVDLSPSVASVTTIEFDQSDGFIVTEVSPGVARIDFTGGSGYSLRVLESDGFPNVSGVNEVRLNQATGLVMSDLGGGAVEVSILLSSLFPPPFYIILPPTPTTPPVVTPSVKYESWYRNVLAAPDETEPVNFAGWFFGGEPNLASNVSMATGQPSEDNFFALPFLSARPGTLDRIAFWLSATGGGGANDKVRLGIYTNRGDQDIYPDALVLDSGEIDCDVVGLRSIAINQALAGNTLYWLTFLCGTTGAPFTIKTIDLTQCWSPLGQDDDWTSNDAGSGWIASQAYGLLPATFPFTGALKLLGVGGVSGRAPAIGVRYASDGALGRGAAAPAGVAPGIAAFGRPPFRGGAIILGP